MTDRDFDVHAYDQGYRDGKADAVREIDRLREALEEARADLSTSLKIDAQKDAAYDKLRAALGEIAAYKRGGDLNTSEKLERDLMIGIARAALENNQ